MQIKANNQILIFTDGACKNNPGPGGFAALLVANDRILEIGGHRESTTNNQMELLAAIQALKITYLIHQPITLYSDSSYVIKGASEWMKNWKKKGWMKSANEPIANQDLWKELDRFIQDQNITWKHIRGHHGYAGNERVDQIAESYAAKRPVPLFRGRLCDYPISIDDLLHVE